MTAKFTAAVAIINIDAVAAWEALTTAQRSALRRCHTQVLGTTMSGQVLPLPLIRVRVDTHARTQDALRRMGVLVSLASDRGKTELTDMGLFIRSTGMAWEASLARRAKDRKGLR